MCLRRFCLTLRTLWSVSFLSSLCLRPVGFLDLCFQLLSRILMKCFFFSLQKQRANAQQMCGGWTGHPDLVGRAAAVLQAKAEGDILHELQLIVASIFSGSLEGDEGSHSSRVWLWPHFTEFPSVNPLRGSHPRLCQTPQRTRQHLWNLGPVL